MNPARLLVIIWLGASLTGGEVCAQDAKVTPVPAGTDEKWWSFEAAGFAYLLPEESDYAQPTLTADRDWLHLEARYNYAGLKAGSAWFGNNWSFGETVKLDLTPMLGGVFGDTAGLALGYKALLSWRKLELISESEYVFDTGSSSDNFLYTWSELAWAPVDWFRFGLVVQRHLRLQSRREQAHGGARREPGLPGRFAAGPD